ncbi:hypothetical protein V6O07_20170, partial [Arthrospira platensis SPKY2]
TVVQAHQERPMAANLIQVPIEPNDPGAFIDFPPARAVPEGHKTCPVCAGHGGWNRKLDVYPLPPDTLDTPENRHRYTHFKMFCRHCWGWGYVSTAVTCPGHEWVAIANLGSCRHRECCLHCGAEIEVDASD